MNLEFSRRLALLGMIPAIAETIRRWHQLGDIKMWPFWLDDLLLGSFLLYGAWLTGKDIVNGRRYLSGAWGFACGMAYLSFFDQITSLDKPDPAPIPSVWVAVVKGMFFLIAIVGLLGSLRGTSKASRRD